MTKRSKALCVGLICVLAIACVRNSIARKLYFNRQVSGIAATLGLEEQSYSIDYVSEKPQVIFSDTSLLIVFKLNGVWHPTAATALADESDVDFGIQAIEELKPASDDVRLPKTIYRFGYERFCCYACFVPDALRIYVWVMGA